MAWKTIAGTDGRYEFDDATKSVRNSRTKRNVKPRMKKGLKVCRLNFGGKSHDLSLNAIEAFRIDGASRMRSCAICGEEFTASRHNEKFCSRKCKKKNDNIKYNGFHVSRAKKHGSEYEYGISLPEVIEKFDGVCQICGGEVDTRIYKKLPTIDHIVPLSHGGAHTWDNVQLACLACNSRKASECS